MGFKVIVKSSEIKFSASHFLKAPPQCARLHGHNYYVTVELSDDLDDNHFVKDFTDIKEKVISIVKPMDHYILIPTKSRDLEIKEDNNSVEIIMAKKRYIFPKEDVFFLPLSSTTSELLAKYIHEKLKEYYPEKKILVKVEESKSTMAVFEE